MRSFVIAAALSLALTGGALAQSSASPTQSTPADGGKRYEYPPNTAAIVRPEDRTPYDRPANDPRSKSSGTEPGTTTDPSRKPPEAVGR